MGLRDENLAREYDRWQAQVGAEDYSDPLAVSATDVLRAHFLLADHFRQMRSGIGGVGPRSLHLLHSAVARQQYVGVGDKRQPRDIFSIAATLFFGLIKNHPFHDANKRTALLTALFQLHSQNRVATTKQSEFEELTVRVAEGSLEKYPKFRDLRNEEDAEARFIAWFFRQNSRKLEKVDPRVSYRQLDQILNRYGFRLANNHDNRIEVVRDVERRTGFLGLRKSRVEERITTIGFRDWGTEVSRRDLQEVRKATELTHDRGYDTLALLRGLDPMESLIATYAEPLRRLARK